MRLISQNKARLTLYAWQEGDEFFLSPYAQAVGSRRPIQRFDTKAELEKAVFDRGNALVWL